MSNEAVNDFHPFLCLLLVLFIVGNRNRSSPKNVRQDPKVSYKLYFTKVTRLFFLICLLNLLNI